MSELRPLSPGLDELVKAILDSSLKVEIPDPASVDLPPEELASLVARASNAYSSAARAAGMARAEAKLAKGRYERKYKTAKNDGRNDNEREANAMASASDAHEAWCNADAVAEVAEGVESAARIASESARKLLDKLEDWRFADSRTGAAANRL